MEGEDEIMGQGAGLERFTPGMGPDHLIPVNGLANPQYPIHRQAWAAPLAADDNYFVNAVAMPDAAETWLAVTAAKFNGVNTKGAGYPDYARNVTAVCSDAQAGNLVVHGLDARGQVISETLTLNGNTPVVGKVAFAQVISLDVPIKAGVETIKVGFADVLGLDMPMTEYALIAETMDGAKATAGTLVLGSTAANADRAGTYDPNSACNATLSFALLYIPTEWLPT